MIPLKNYLNLFMVVMKIIILFKVVLQCIIGMNKLIQFHLINLEHNGNKRCVDPNLGFSK